MDWWFFLLGTNGRQIFVVRFVRLGNEMRIKLLVQIAKGEADVMKMAQDTIGKGEVALLLANAAVQHTSIKLSPKRVGKVLGLTESGDAR
jgi:hypothetical protein